MPLITIPDHIRQTILFDFVLKTPTVDAPENENTESEFNQQTRVPFTTISNATRAYAFVENNKTVNRPPLKSKERNQSEMNSPWLIYSTKGHNRFFKENDNPVETFISENNICTFDKFLSTVKEGSLTKLLQLNFLKNHFTAQDVDGNNALILATFFNFTNIMEYLLANKSPVGLRNAQRYSSIDIAAALGNIKAIEILIHHGGCEELEEQDCSAIFYAYQNGYTQIVDILRAKIKQNFDEHQERRRYRVPIRI